MSKTTIVCLTPVKNEAWILDRFLQCTSLWADHIIIADQGSDDGSRKIAQSYEKVILVDNPSTTFNEPERQKILLEKARSIPGRRLLIALDADEIITANFMNSLEWNTVLNSPQGTVIRFQWVNLRPDLRSCWLPSNELALGFMDNDNCKHRGRKIHSFRIPIPENAPIISLRDIKLLHYQYTDWERMKSKHRWYQCWERLNQPSRKAVDIYRQYHHMYAVDKTEIYPLPREWLLGYEKKGIDMTSIHRQNIYWWDKQVLEWLAKHGSEKFKRESIWDVDWSNLSNKVNPSGSQIDFKDPRSHFYKYFHHWLRKTQPIASRREVRTIDKVLSLLE